ncbi:dihydrofolate reductase family protein [Flavobacterium selenitireducens]|uniref:dihydrofolate reductase family protein n=1 Tax=Flavobacterium selenitireducens TaxID=2722704 RepID=UPI00168A891B|nr:dihydrofolate reductase family protein [Flavobacterium selenitireducens]MBD3582839.1 dihydrofolate reductase [Flavobacterium selenitireducens]
MRKITVLSMITLDGVMQAPGTPDEDRSNGFEFGGWIAPYDDEVSAEIMQRLLQPADLLIGRKTFEIWERYWPQHTENWPTINEVNKFVLSGTRRDTDWKNCIFIDSVADVKKLKQSDGADIQVWGSGKIVQLLLRNDMVDELWLMIHPLTLGNGKKLFTDGPIPAAFSLAESAVTTKGVIIARYERAGDVETGTVGG